MDLLPVLQGQKVVEEKEGRGPLCGHVLGLDLGQRGNKKMVKVVVLYDAILPRVAFDSGAVKTNFPTSGNI